jgi:prepilin-type N-terminal cleavage/methylation domain-containing protein
MRKSRGGFSLIEVMVAMAVCLMGLTLLLQMTSLAQRFAQRSMDLAEEQIICQNLLNEIRAGSLSWSPKNNQQYAPNPLFEYTIRTEWNKTLGLRWVEVAVRRADQTPANSQATTRTNDRATDRQSSAREFRLARLIPAEPDETKSPESSPIRLDDEEANR